VFGQENELSVYYKFNIAREVIMSAKIIQPMLGKITVRIVLPFLLVWLLATTESAAQNFWQQASNGLYGGDVRALAINLRGHILAGTLGGGIFRGLPSIFEHTLQSVQNADQKILIVAKTTGARSIVGVTLSYRRGGEANFIAVSMLASSDSFKVTIPADYVTSRGVEYFIEATDASDLKERKPPSGIFSIQVKVPDPGVMKGSAQTHGSEQTAYRLISVPLSLDNKDARAVLEDDLGQYKKSKWRFYELLSDQMYTELPNTSQMTPGKAFWLIVKDAGKVIDTGVGISNKTSEEYAITLHPKWNFVANPFNFPIPMDNIRLKSGKLFKLRSFTGSWDTTKVEEMPPFEGYALFIESQDTLLINPDPTDITSSLPKSLPPLVREEIQWSIHILAQCQQACDVDNTAAIVSGASNSLDELDQPEPPIIGEYVSVYFPHREWTAPVGNTLAKTYCIDARPEPTDGEVWEFEVKNQHPRQSEFDI
jgi:hypothetical protein